MSDSIQQLKQLVNNIHSLPEKDVVAFAEAFKPHAVLKKQVLTTIGNKERYLYFVTEGVQRIYSLDQNEKEATILFTYPYSFGGVLDSFMLQQSSKYCYESLTASSFLRITYNDLQEVRKQYPSIEIMLNKGLTLALSGVLERLAEIQSLTAEEKLRRLFKRSPHIFQLVPQKYLANYLGIDPTNFSKFMNSVKM
jgi:CRP-like cAMP-binding protein